MSRWVCLREMNMMFCQSIKPLVLMVTALLALTTGCRNRGVNTEPLELENFALNEKILQLEVELAQMQARLEREREKEKDEQSDSSSSSRSRSRSDRQERKDEQPDLPDIELGDPVKPGSDSPELQSAPKFESRNRSSGRSAAQAVSASRPDVSYITLNAQETVAISGGEEDGIVVVLEPRDGSGKLVRAAGQIAIAVWDQGLLDQYRGNSARQSEAQMGVWTFTASEVQGHLDQSSDGRIRIELPWPHRPPEHGRIRVYVRYVTHNGKELRAELPLVVENADGASPQPSAEELPAPPPTVRETRRDEAPPEFPELEKVPATEDGAAKAGERGGARDARRPRWSPYR